MQDLIFMGGSIVLNAFFLPTLWSRHKPPKVTAGAFTIVMVVFTANFFSLGMELATVMHSIATILWGIVYFQKRVA